MNEMMIINVGIIVLFVLIFIFFYIKDSESQRRLARFEHSLDELNKDLYKLQKHRPTRDSYGFPQVA